jgi:predicted amidophosphoribosyltransferase
MRRRKQRVSNQTERECPFCHKVTKRMKRTCPLCGVADPPEAEYRIRRRPTMSAEEYYELREEMERRLG